MAFIEYAGDTVARKYKETILKHVRWHGKPMELKISKVETKIIRCGNKAGTDKIKIEANEF